MSDDADRKRRDDKADDLQGARERLHAALEGANSAAIGSPAFRDAMAEVKEAEEAVRKASRD
jgi:hypothetical protein